MPSRLLIKPLQTASSRADRSRDSTSRAPYAMRHPNVGSPVSCMHAAPALGRLLKHRIIQGHQRLQRRIGGDAARQACIAVGGVEGQ